MRNFSIKDYFLYIIVNFLSKILTKLPFKLVVFQGKIIGLILYYLDKKHRDIAHKNLRMCLASYKSQKELNKILKKNFQNLMMNLFETLIIPKFDRGYIQKNIEVQGIENLEEALSQNKGVILLGIHMGNWEICFAVAGSLGFPFYILAEEQTKFFLLDKFLNRIRESKGIKVICAGKSNLRQVIRVLKENKILGMVADHGIKEGIPLEFFGHITLTPSLAMRLALDLDAIVIPGYIIRKGILKHKIVLLAPLKVRDTSNLKEDLLYNLREVNRIVENCIKEYPEDYLWFYKRFKYNRDRTILVLEDARIGHQKQLEAFVKMAKEVAKEKDLLIKVERIKVEFKSPFSKTMQILGTGLAKKSQCQRCLWCLKKFLTEENFLKLHSTYADIVVSCGSSLAGVNFVISSLNQARSVVIMRPSILSTKRFDLVIAPYHDRLPSRKNTIFIEGSLSFMEESFLEEASVKLKNLINRRNFSSYIGLLIGGDTKDFRLKREVICQVLVQLKKFAESKNVGILLTTSRRTSKEIENLIKEELKDFSHLALLIIANEMNFPFIVEGILGLSRWVVVSPESISMISEAISAGKYILVFKQSISNRRHKNFLRRLSERKYIYLIEAQDINHTLEEIFLKRPKIPILNEREKLYDAIERIL
ncbi:MAG: mitochondrial fission ELM1 family protein [Candidatus Omnitrophica bacterium]|nr:mitochondrial fission ELM1 family protein [Candidatus Omnitrophota bacterium]MCM8800065.1 mitochondrial fission ELM1 family protein [Candidatus Omnitrophota bacterium]